MKQIIKLKIYKLLHKFTISYFKSNNKILREFVKIYNPEGNNSYKNWRLESYE